jgi:gliding motility-associated-like protein
MATRLFSFKSYNKLLTWSLFLTSLIISSLHAQCPTVINSLQSFCDIEPILVENLVATDNGSGVVWYDTLTSTTALLNIEGLIDGEDYYADDNTGTCGPRQRVDVIIYGPPDGLNFQGFCLDESNVATIADLIATGNNVQWYLTQTGGVPLTDPTILIDNFIYYADQENPDTGCKTSRLSVLVNVGLTPVPSGDSVQEFCVTPNSTPIVEDLIASSINNWYISLFSASPLPSSTPLINGQVYYASTIDPPCESSGRLAVLVLLTNSPDPGMNSTLDLCENASSIDLFTVLGGSPNSGGTWSPSLNSGTGLFDPILDPQGVYTYTISSINTCSEQSSTVTVTVSPQPIAGTNGSTDLCTNSSIVDLFDSLGGTPEPGGTWSPMLDSGAGVFDPSIDEGGIYTYTVSGTPPCPDASASVTVLLSTVTNAGEDASIEICDDIGTVDLFNSLGGAPDLGGTWSPSLNSGTGIFNPSIDAEGTYNYTVFGTPPCVDDSASVTVTISELPNTGSDAAIQLCSNDGTLDLFNSLGGTPDADGTWSPLLASGTGIFDPSIDPEGIYTYSISSATACTDVSSNVNVSLEIATEAGEDTTLEVCDDIGTIDLFNSLDGTPDAGGTWSPTLASGTNIFDPDMDVEGTYIYTVSGTPPCTDDSASMSITVGELPNTGSDATIQICSNNGTIDLFDSLGGTPDSGGTWSPALASGTGVFNPTIDFQGTYTYSISSSSVCTDASSNVNVSVEVVPEAGENGSIAICDDNGLINLFDSLGATAEAGGNWSPALASGTSIFDPTIDPEGIYTYTISATPPCIDDSADVTITVNELPSTGTDTIIQLCSDNGTLDLFNSLGGTPDAGGTWSPILASGTGIFNPSIDAEGIYTYSISGTSVCSDASSSVNVSVQTAPEAGENASLEICDNNGTIDLFNSLGGTPDTGGTWSPTLSSGTSIFDPTLDSEGTYIYTLLGTSPCINDSASIIITVNETPNAGSDASITICSNDGTIDLFDSLGTTTDTGGTWSPALASGTGIFDPTLDPEDTYTYTVSGTPPCADDSASVTISVSELPNTGTDATIQLCSNNGTVDLFDSLGGTPDTGGTWSPALSSGTGIFDPTLDPEDTYTYSISGTTTCADASSSVNVSLEMAPEAGDNTAIEVCDNNGTIDLFDSLDGTPDTGGTWSPNLSSGTNIFDPTLDTDGTYIYTVIGASPCIDDSASITITVNETANAGNNASINLCNNSADIDLFDSLGGTPETGGTWSPSLASGTGVFNPSIDAEGIYTYTLTGVPPCGDTSATINVTLSEVSNAGTDASITVCSNGDSIDLFDSIGGSPDTGGNWSPSLNSATGVFDPSIDLEGTYTYTVSGTSPCPDASTDITIVITDSLDAGENSTVNFCRNESPTDLFDALEGSPQLGGTWSPTLNSGTGVFDPSIDLEDIYTYTLSGATAPCIDDSATVNVTIITEPNAGESGTVDICDNGDIIFLFDFLQGTPELGGTWSPTPASGTDEFNPAIDPSDQYTYTIAGIDPCSNASATVEVTILVSVADAGENGSVEVCNNSDIIFLFDFLQGSPQPGGTWSPELPSGTDEFNPAIDSAGQYTYTIADIAPCDDSSAIVTVSIIPEPNAGIDSVITICIDDTATDLFNFLGGMPDTNGIWSPALTSGTGVFDPSIDLEGTYTYTVTSSVCNLMDISSVRVTIVEKPDVSGALLTSEPSICIGSDIPVELSDANQLIDGIYTIDYVITGTNTTSSTIDITVSGGSASFLIQSDLIQNSGLTFITITGFYFVGEFCSGDTDLIALVEITILETQTPQISNEGSQFCLQERPTIADLSNNIIDSETIIWYNLPENGIAYSDSDLLEDGVTYYAAIQGANGCESTVRLEVTASVIECLYELIIPDGFSPNGDPINDNFHIVNLEILYPNFKLSVYNRYGNILYEGNIDSQRWNGTSTNSDKVLPAGVYFYILEFNDGERKPIQGRVYLSR